MVLGINQTIGDLIVRRRFVGIYIKEIVISFISTDGTGNQRARPLAALFLHDHCCQDVRIDIRCLSYRIDKRSVIAVTTARFSRLHKGSLHYCRYRIGILIAAVIAVSHELINACIIQEVSRIHIICDDLLACRIPSAICR